MRARVSETVQRPRKARGDLQAERSVHENFCCRVDATVQRCREQLCFRVLLPLRKREACRLFFFFIRLSVLWTIMRRISEFCGPLWECFQNYKVERTHLTGLSGRNTSRGGSPHIARTSRPPAQIFPQANENNDVSGVGTGLIKGAVLVYRVNSNQVRRAQLRRARVAFLRVPERCVRTHRFRSKSPRASS